MSDHRLPWPWLEKLRAWWRKADNLLLVLTIVGVLVGTVIGLTLRLSKPSKETIQLVLLPGDILMNMLKMLTVPLIVSSLITGISVLDAKSCGKISSYAMTYYFVTTVVASITGIILVLTIHPGRPWITGADIAQEQKKSYTTALDTFVDMIESVFPENLVRACVEQPSTIYESAFKNQSFQKVMFNTTNETIIQAYFQSEIDKSLANLGDRIGLFEGKSLSRRVYLLGNYTDNVTDMTYVNATVEIPVIFRRADASQPYTNVLGLVCFAIFFGIVLGRLGKRGELMKRFFCSLNDVVMEMVKLIMWYSPIGIAFLITGKFLAIEKLMMTLQQLALYMTTVIVGLLIHALGTLVIIFYLSTRQNPWKYMKGILNAWVTAVGTASSAATLPVTFKCCEESLHIDKRVTRFVLPVGATINMDGTALYEAVAAIFIAQRNNIELSLGQVITVSITATLASIGAAAIPSAGLVTMIIVLTAVNLPVSDISLIVAIDWLLDRLRTSVNVLGDAFGAGIVAHLCRRELELMPPLEEDLEMKEAGIGEAKADGNNYKAKNYLADGGGSGPGGDKHNPEAIPLTNVVVHGGEIC